MRSKLMKILTAAVVVTVALFGFVVQTAAVDNSYTFDEFGMTIKFPREDYVITQDSERDDEAFTAVDLDYDETITAFKAADIYLRAYDPDLTYQISLTVIKNDNSTAVNNYSDLTAAERASILESITSNSTVTSAVEIKHNGIIYFDSEQQTTIDGETVYINQCNTIVNGYQIDLTMQKSGEAITTDEAKALTSAANSLSFDNIVSNSGPVFGIGQILLWIISVVVILGLISFIYRQYNASQKRHREERRTHRPSVTDEVDTKQTEQSSAEEPHRQLSFEEILGYSNDEEFSKRAPAEDMASYDINVQDKNPAKGIAYFEDEGSSIDDGSDYFDTYFREPTVKRSGVQRFFSTIGAYITIALTHTGYFFKNLFHKIFKRK